MAGQYARATESQKEYLLSYMERHLAFRQREYVTAEGRTFWRNQWQKLAEALNNIPGGAFKDVDGWIRYWNDQKKNARKNPSAVAQYVNRGTGGGPPPDTLLSVYERRLLKCDGGWSRVVGFEGVLDPLECDDPTPPLQFSNQLRERRPVFKHEPFTAIPAATHSSAGHAPHPSYSGYDNPSLMKRPSMQGSSQVKREKMDRQNDETVCTVDLTDDFIEADNYDILPSPSQLDMDWLDALPDNIRHEVLEAYSSRKKGDSRTAALTPPVTPPVKASYHGNPIVPSTSLDMNYEDAPAPHPVEGTSPVQIVKSSPLEYKKSLYSVNEGTFTSLKAVGPRRPVQLEVKRAQVNLPTPASDYNNNASQPLKGLFAPVKIVAKSSGTNPVTPPVKASYHGNPIVPSTSLDMNYEDAPAPHPVKGTSAPMKFVKISLVTNKNEKVPLKETTRFNITVPSTPFEYKKSLFSVNEGTFTSLKAVGPRRPVQLEVKRAQVNLPTPASDYNNNASQPLKGLSAPVKIVAKSSGTNPATPPVKASYHGNPIVPSTSLVMNFEDAPASHPVEGTSPVQIVKRTQVNLPTPASDNNNNARAVVPEGTLIESSSPPRAASAVSRAGRTRKPKKPYSPS